MDTNIDFERWADGDDDDLESALNSTRASSPFHSLPVSSQSGSATAAVFTMTSLHQSSSSSSSASSASSVETVLSPLGGLGSSGTSLIFTSSAQQQPSSQQPTSLVVVSQSPRITNSTLVFSSSSSPQHHHHSGSSQYTLINGLQKTSWSGHADTDHLLEDNQNLHDSLGMLFSYSHVWE